MTLNIEIELNDSSERKFKWLQEEMGGVDDGAVISNALHLALKMFKNKDKQYFIEKVK